MNKLFYLFYLFILGHGIFRNNFLFIYFFWKINDPKPN